VRLIQRPRGITDEGPCGALVAATERRAVKAGRENRYKEDFVSSQQMCVHDAHAGSGGHDRFPMEYLTRVFPDRRSSDLKILRRI
jgi:hypothetical protein